MKYILRIVLVILLIITSIPLMLFMAFRSLYEWDFSIITGLGDYLEDEITDIFIKKR